MTQNRSKPRPIANSAPKGYKGMFRSLESRNFRLFVTGQSISLIGTWIQRIAMPWLVYDLTHSVFLLGLIGFTGQIPVFLLGPFAGVITDRWNKRNLLLYTQALAMLQAFAIALLIVLGIVQIWMLIILSIILGCITALDNPARQSFLIEMVGKKENLGNAIALNSTMVNVARLIGPSIAGIILASTGESACFAINGLSFLLVIISLLRMRIEQQTLKPKQSQFLSSFKEGIKYTFGFAPIKAVILLLALMSLMGMPYAVLMPVFAKEILHGGSHTFGFLMGATGLGALMGAIYLASRKNVLGLEKLIPFACVLFGAGLIAFSFSRYLPLSLFFLIFAGLGMMMQMASSNTIIQTIVDDDKRGRVMSFYSMALMGTAPFGSLIFGSLAQWIGAPHTLVIGGISCILGAIVFIKNLPNLKTQIHPIYIQQGIMENPLDNLEE
ncbi:MFS transporter [Microbacter margulisiae]|uniref:MFS family permease n=1 Tax=Microbacter margulisiae TaxID=1350067 RepID=A0A7W5DP52_9PORP|nr:MFS transporter [Microbacter margulisiae]MBB3186361.1 MFS family permease [Microbacter margulisiae]